MTTASIATTAPPATGAIWNSDPVDGGVVGVLAGGVVGVLAGGVVGVLAGGVVLT